MDPCFSPASVVLSSYLVSDLEQIEAIEAIEAVEAIEAIKTIEDIVAIL